MSWWWKISLLSVLSLFFSIFASAQPAPLIKNNQPNAINIMFYNVENLFDTYNDSLTNDDDFLPSGKYHWTKKKYDRKLENLSKVILSITADPPMLVGMAEVENKLVLNQLCQNTPLLKFGYKSIHHNSPDPRGIDVALLYRPDLFKPIKSDFIRINFKDEPKRKTRDILYSKGLILKSDTLHVFINHWPSRRNGEAESSVYRNTVATILRAKIDSLFKFQPNAKIIVLGDFNDEPDNESLYKYLKTYKPETIIKPKQLYNLSWLWLNGLNKTGTHKFQGNWAILDQIIVSSALLDSKKGLYCKANMARIFDESFIQVTDKSNTGFQPFRTYSGFKYQGGFSDHLPVFISLEFK